MFKKRGSKKVELAVYIILVSMLFCFLALTIFADRKGRRDDESINSKFQFEIQELQLEKEALLVEYANVEEYYLNRIADGSYIGIIFTELNQSLYDDVYPMFNKRTDGQYREERIIGYMALYDGNMPGDPDCISVEDFSNMVYNGWEYVLYWDGEEDLEDYIARMKTEFVNRGIPKFPDTILFKSRTYSTSYDHLLKREGISHVIHHGEEKLPIIERNIQGDVWHVGSLGWNTHGQANLLLTEIIRNKGIAMFEVNFTDLSGEFLFDIDQSDRTAAFGRMLDTIEQLIIDDKVKVTNFDIAWEGRIRYHDAAQVALKDIEVRKFEILERIDEINAAINKKYTELYSN